MLIGYVRVGKNEDGEILELQKKALVATGVEESHIYYDIDLDKTNNTQPALQTCLKSLQKNDTLIVWTLERLGHDLRQLVLFINELFQKKAEFKVLSGETSPIDTTTKDVELVYQIFAALAAFQRTAIQKQTKAGLEALRARGRYGGRPRKMDSISLRKAMKAMADPKAIASEVAQNLNLTTATLYRYVNGDGSLKKPGEALLQNEDFINKNNTNSSNKNFRAYHL